MNDDQLMADGPYAGLARRLAAAFVSYQLGLKGVDYTMRTDFAEGEPIGDFWMRLAKDVSEALAPVIVGAVFANEVRQEVRHHPRSHFRHGR